MKMAAKLLLCVLVIQLHIATPSSTVQILKQDQPGKAMEMKTKGTNQNLERNIPKVILY